MEPLHLQGRTVIEEDIRLIQGLIEAHPDWSRRRLSQELCHLWQWVNPAGQLKDMACRSLLAKLDDRGLVSLPASRRNGSARQARKIPFVPHDTTPIRTSLAALQPLQVHLIHTGPDWDLFRCLLVQYHYLGFRRPVGESLRYLIHDRQGRLVAGLLFGSAAWKLAARDAFIDWSPEQRRQRLQWVTNNTRFLIPPWVEVPHLASHALALVTRRLSSDWQQRYGHPIMLIETFVGPQFQGTCYRAANWRYLGQTQGRGRNDIAHTRNQTQKSIFVYPLARRFREVLSP